MHYTILCGTFYLSPKFFIYVCFLSLSMHFLCIKGDLRKIDTATNHPPTIKKRKKQRKETYVRITYVYLPFIKRKVGILICYTCVTLSKRESNTLYTHSSLEERELCTNIYTSFFPRKKERCINIKRKKYIKKEKLSIFIFSSSIFCSSSFR